MKSKYTVEMTRDELREAHEALDALCGYIQLDSGIYPEANREFILSALPPKPRPTMAEIGWDEDEHYLAEAVHPEYGKVMMVACTGGGPIDILTRKGNSMPYRSALPEELEPTGRHYFRNDNSKEQQ